MARFAIPLALIIAALLACGSEAAPLQNLRTRAAFEFDCPESKIVVRNLDDQTDAYGVQGCGHRAVYIWHCSADDECKWVLNSDVR